MAVTNLRRTIEARLEKVEPGLTLAAYLERCRTDGWSWYQMQRDLESRTGVLVSHETLRRWHSQP